MYRYNDGEMERDQAGGAAPIVINLPASSSCLPDNTAMGVHAVIILFLLSF